MHRKGKAGILSNGSIKKDKNSNFEYKTRTKCSKYCVKCCHRYCFECETPRSDKSLKKNKFVNKISKKTKNLIE